MYDLKTLCQKAFYHDEAGEYEQGLVLCKKVVSLLEYNNWHSMADPYKRRVPEYETLVDTARKAKSLEENGKYTEAVANYKKLIALLIEEKRDGYIRQAKEYQKRVTELENLVD